MAKFTMSVVSCLLTLATLSTAQLIPGSLDWCNYWRSLGQGNRPECSGQQVNTLPFCTTSTNLLSCSSNSQCSSGRSCVSNGVLCCTQTFANGICPSVQNLGIQCNKTNPTNWCNNNDDCHTAPVPLCCPTGCGYNLCISGGQPILANPSNSIFRDPLCPTTELIEIQCEKTNPTFWCMDQTQCQDRNSAQQRRCCPTRCSYNVCLLNYNGKWIIA